MQIRASSLSRHIKCPASVAGNKYSSIGSVYSDAGTNAHKLAHEAYLAITSGEDVSNFDSNSDYFQFANYCANNGFNIWEKSLEKSVFGITLTGHPDVFRINGDEIAIIDFKSGYNQILVEDNAQLLAYAFLLLPEQSEGDLKIKISIWQNGLKPVFEYSTKNVIDFIFSEFTKIKENPNLYKTGNHCNYCPMLNICPEHKKNIELIAANQLSAETMTDDELVDLRIKTSMIAKIHDSVGDELKKRLLAGAVINGVKLSETKNYEFIYKPAEFIKMLLDGGIAYEDFNELVKLNITSLRKICKKYGLDAGAYICEGEPTKKLTIK